MNHLTLTSAVVVVVLYAGWVHTDELPYHIRQRGTTGQVRFVSPYGMEIVAAEPGCGCTGVRLPKATKLD